MVSYWERAHTEGQAWGDIFAKIDPVIEAFAKDRGYEITKDHWDAPDRHVSWSDGLVNRHIHISLRGEPNKYQVVFEISAWQDLDAERVWYSEKMDTVAPKDIDWMFQKVLGSAHSKVLGWSKNFVERKGKRSKIRARPG